MADNDKVVVNKEKQSFLSKIANSFAGIPLGIFLVILGIFLLGNNEKNNVRNIKDVKELRNNVVDLSSPKVDSKNEGKLVALSGKLEYGENPIVDTLFNISAKTPKLERVVEMYEWVEDSTENDKKVTYTYSKEWSQKIIDSSNFNTTNGHENPTSMPYEGISLVVEDSLKVGEFVLIDSFKDQISATEDYKDFTNAILAEGYTINNNYITNSIDPANPQIGDVRISYKVAQYDNVSILGKQIDNTVGAYDTKTNTSYAKLYKGIMNANQMINSIEKGAKASKWFMRIVGTLIIIMGVSMILGPITTLIGFIPFLGNIVNSMIGVVSFLIGLVISLIVIAIAWFAARPIVAIISLASAAALAIGLIFYFKKNKDANTSKEVKKVEEK